MHHIHHTEGLVLGGYARGEADKQISLYTRDFGLVKADARGVRKLSSKLRFALQPYMVVRIDLINTKVAYRAGSTDLLLGIETPDMATLAMLHRVASLIRRLVPEQEKNEPLYEAIIEVMNFLSKKSKEKLISNVTSLELLAVFRILYHLGYVTESGERSIVREPITDQLLEQVAMRREDLVKEVNNSLRETML
ncbi:MAG: hypothetical protein RL641_132 [Candidatus Parcubacteria bacterium]|jgi:DNA repair protein RecO (recombination protein O)